MKQWQEEFLECSNSQFGKFSIIYFGVMILLSAIVQRPIMAIPDIAAMTLFFIFVVPKIYKFTNR